MVVPNKFWKFNSLTVVLCVGTSASEMGVQLGGKHLNASTGKTLRANDNISLKYHNNYTQDELS